MYKKILIIIISLLIVTGCKNTIEEEKNEYLDTKSILETTDKFAALEDLPCDITISLDRIDNENIRYVVLFNNPKRDMKDIKILVIHNQYTEDVFPSIGLLDKKSKSLLIDDYDNNEIKIDGNIESTNDIESLKLEYRVWLEYIDNNNEKQTIYYKTTI